MSAAAIVAYLLSSNDAFTALVPSERILATTRLPTGILLPAVNAFAVTGQLFRTVSMSEPKRLHTDRVQVTVHASNEISRKQIFEAIPECCSPARGHINGYWVECVTPDIEGPDLSDAAASIFERPRDFIVQWIPPPPAIALEGGGLVLLEDGGRILTE